MCLNIDFFTADCARFTTDLNSVAGERLRPLSNGMMCSRCKTDHNSGAEDFIPSVME